ncbi:MAG: serine/threonine protein kinase, partial [Desulfofustis sp.]
MTDSPFSPLEPDVVLGCVEEQTGRRLLNVCRPHASYINRVYEVQDENGDYLVAKFYRPGRWSRGALEDEQRFVG